MSDIYKQCKLKKDNSTYVAWIPKKFAKVGKTVKLEMDGVWQDGWTVLDVGSEAEYNDINEQSQEHKKHRSITDI